MKLKNEVRCNIVTVVVSFNVNRDGRLQHDINLKPSEWSSRPLTHEEIQRLKYLDQSDAIKGNHYSHLYVFLQQVIQEVATEQTIDGDKTEDSIDTEVEQEIKAKLYKKCYQCYFEEIPKAKHACPMVKVNMTKSKMKSMGLDENGMVKE